MVKTAQPSQEAAPPAAKKKKKRLKSWERKVQKKRAENGAVGGTEASLNQTAASAKLASLAARERLRLGQAALSRDAGLVAAYVAARKAMSAFLKAKPEGAISKGKKKRNKRKEGDSES